VSEQVPTPEYQLTLLQDVALSSLCERYAVAYDPRHYGPAFDLPPDWVEGWVGGPEIQQTHPTIFVGCSPEGEVHS
jgi:hypothetical protein